ncbi:MAG: response regulator transcription factor [Candidatus Helarchaeota archaeon]
MKKVKILVVDDEPDTVLLARRLLELEGYNVIAAYDGEEALQKIYSEQPQIVLLDLKLPKKDGFEVCNEIKSRPEYKDIVIIMFTAKIFNSDRERGFQVGADYYITKPFSARDLISLLQEILEK